MAKQPRKPVKWVGSAKRDLDTMPEDVKDVFGHAIDLAQAGKDGFFDAAGLPVGGGWDEAPAHELEDGLFALEVTGDDLAPVYRDGDRLLVSPSQEPRKGDRVVARTTAGEVLVRELGRVTARTLELVALDHIGEPRLLSRDEVAWVARIVWVSQ